MDLHGRIWRHNANSGGTFFFCFSVRALGKRSEEIGRREESLVTCFLIDELLGRALSACDKAARSEFSVATYSTCHRDHDSPPEAPCRLP